jgi:hypothetical protein
VAGTVNPDACGSNRSQSAAAAACWRNQSRIASR